MLRAEMVTAVVGAALGVHPFDQPNVEAAKVLAKKAMSGELDLAGVPTVSADQAQEGLSSLLSSVVLGDYVGIHAYLAPNDATWERLTAFRVAVGARTGVATTLGWGPRFLHSTGQLHKGGPDSGVFIQFVDQPSSAVPIPETDHDFASLVQAQAAGDHQALVEAGRRVIRIDLGTDPDQAIGALTVAVS